MTRTSNESMNDKNKDENVFPKILTKEWFSNTIGVEVEQIRCDDGSKGLEGGISGSLERVHLDYSPSLQEDDFPSTVIVKRTKDEEMSRLLGKAREAWMYIHYQKMLKTMIPHIYYAKGDMKTGEELIVMEDLKSCIQAGHLFGPSSPCNWNVNLDDSTKDYVGSYDWANAESVTYLCFQTIARWHAQFWMCQRNDFPMKDLTWLRGAESILSDDQHVPKESAWHTAQATYTRACHAILEKKVSTDVTWHPQMLSLIKAAMAKIDWSTYRNEWKSRPWTLIHGDFHPANVLLQAASTPRVIFLDFEMVGLGSGPQDLGQFLISHMEPNLRRKIEKKATETYYETLISYDKIKDYTFSQCWSDYIEGAIGRWLWLLVVLAGNSYPAPMIQFFHDQVFDFVQTHAITETNVPMPRV